MSPDVRSRYWSHFLNYEMEMVIHDDLYERVGMLDFFFSFIMRKVAKWYTGEAEESWDGSKLSSLLDCVLHQLVHFFFPGWLHWLIFRPFTRFDSVQASGSRKISCTDILFIWTCYGHRSSNVCESFLHCTTPLKETWSSMYPWRRGKKICTVKMFSLP